MDGCAQTNIGIIGAGKIGGALGELWARAGHAVMFASRHPDQLAGLAGEVGASLGTPAEAAVFGDVVVIAVPDAAFAGIAAAGRVRLRLPSGGKNCGSNRLGGAF